MGSRSPWPNDSRRDGIAFLDPNDGGNALEVSWDRFGQLIKDLSRSIPPGSGPDVIIGAFQGGWIVAQALCDQFPAAVCLGAACRKRSDNSFASVLFPTEDDSTEEARHYIAGRNVLLVDEVIESGRTIEFHTESIQRCCPRSLATGALFVSDRCGIKVDYHVETFGADIKIVLPWRHQRDGAQPA